MVQEYRRTCYHCETVWHSLKSREDALAATSAGTVAGGPVEGSARSCSYCGMCRGAVFTMGPRGSADGKEELERLRTCPNCGSHSYFEEVLEQGHIEGQ